MSDFEQAWATADPDATGGGGDDLDPPMDGTYDVALIDASAFTAKSGAAFTKTQYKVVSANQQDYEWTVLNGFKSQAQANITKRECRSLGIDIDTVTSLEALDAALKEKVGQYYTVDVKTNGQFRNTYVNESGPVHPDIPLPEMPEPEQAPSAVPTGADEDVPFYPDV